MRLLRAKKQMRSQTSWKVHVFVRAVRDRRLRAGQVNRAGVWVKPGKQIGWRTRPLARSGETFRIRNRSELREALRACNERGSLSPRRGDRQWPGLRPGTGSRGDHLRPPDGFAAGRAWCEANRLVFDHDAYGTSKRAVNLWTRRVAPGLRAALGRGAPAGPPALTLAVG